jgi:hypothetical protein
VLVAHDYNPGHSGGRNQEDCSLKSVLANRSLRPYLKKKKVTKKDWWTGSRDNPEFKLITSPETKEGL